MKARVAYVEEPPFYWTAADRSASGADVELAHVALAVIGETSIEFVPVAFAELFSDVSEGRWEMNVPIFITPERQRRARFSIPVWSLGDGFLVRGGNPKSLASYSSVDSDVTTRLGLIPGQAQLDAVMAASVPSDQVVTFAGQSEAAAALLARGIDAFAATALDDRAVVADMPALESVAFPEAGALRRYLGSVDHRAKIAK